MSTERRTGVNPTSGRFRALQKQHGLFLPNSGGAAILLEALKLMDGLQPTMSIGQMVLSMARQTTLPGITPIVGHAIAQCDEQVQGNSFAWIDSINQHVGAREFWQRPVDDVLIDTGHHAADLWSAAGYSENKEKFAQFQAMLFWIVMFNLVRATLSDPGRKQFVERAIKVGLLGRLFG